MTFRTSHGEGICFLFFHPSPFPGSLGGGEAWREGGGCTTYCYLSVAVSDPDLITGHFGWLLGLCWHDLFVSCDFSQCMFGFTLSPTVILLGREVSLLSHAFGLQPPVSFLHLATGYHNLCLSLIPQPFHMEQFSLLYPPRTTRDCGVEGCL